MSNFALDTGSSAGDIISGLNYALANLGNQTGAATTTANVLTANIQTGNISTTYSNIAGYPSTTIVSYLYGYLDVAYANTATGGGFTSNSANQKYYGIRNTSTPVFDTNPVDYSWYQVVGGFGSTKSLFYQNVGGNQINFYIGTAAPTVNFSPVLDSTPILLSTLANSIVTSNTIQPQAVTNVQIASNTIQGNNIQQNTITGNLIQANTITGNLIQANTIQGNSIVAGSITATQLQANLLTVGNIVSFGQTIESTSGTGYWLDYTNGNVYFGGNTTIGNTLRVGTNATIGGNLNVTGLVTAGNLQSNTVNTTTIVQFAVSNGIGASSSNWVTYNSPILADNNTNSSVYYIYPYATATISNVATTSYVYINANYNSYFVSSSNSTYTIYASLLQSQSGVSGNAVLQKQTTVFNTTANAPNYLNTSFTYLDLGLGATGTNNYTYYIAWSVYGPVAGQQVSNLTSVTFYEGTLVAQILKR